jgi:hypothetical protein
MIIMHGVSDGHLMVLIGLSRNNCERLLEGKPIHKGPDTTRAPMTIIIVGGETEEDIAKELEERGLLEETQIFNDKAVYEKEKKKCDPSRA